MCRANRRLQIRSKNIQHGDNKIICLGFPSGSIKKNFLKKRRKGIYFFIKKKKISKKRVQRSWYKNKRCFWNMNENPALNASVGKASWRVHFFFFGYDQCLEKHEERISVRKEKGKKNLTAVFHPKINVWCFFFRVDIGWISF